MGRHQSALLKDLWEVHQHSVAFVHQPVMALQIVQVACAVVYSHSNRYGKEVLSECTGAPWRRGELHTGVILSLDLVLMFRKERQVTDVVQDDAIVYVPLEASHAVREHFQRADFQVQDILEKRLDPLSLTSVRSTQHQEQRIAQTVLAEHC